MNKFLRNGFSALINIGFIVCVIGVTVWGGIIGHGLGRFSGSIIPTLLGILIGFWIGLITGFEIFGFLATIIHISQNSDRILSELQKKKVPENKKTFVTPGTIPSTDSLRSGV